MYIQYIHMYQTSHLEIGRIILRIGAEHRDDFALPTQFCLTSYPFNPSMLFSYYISIEANISFD